MRTRLSSHHFTRFSRTAPAVSSPTFPGSTPGSTVFGSTVFGSSARRLTLALAASAPVCAGALLAHPVQAAPTVESDENGPLVQIIRPGYNDVLKGKYRILIQVTARKFNPESVEMFIDDKSATSGPMPISSFASSSYDFPTTSWPEGRHKLTVRVTDAQGFRGWSETTIFINNKGVVDNQKPDLRWLGVEPFQEVSGAVKLEVNAADNFGVKMLQISISPVDSPNKPVYSWFMNQPPYKVNIDTIGKNIPDGLYVAKALAWDSLDQQGEASALTFGVLNDQINATRVEEMLDGQRQMARVLKGQAPEASSAAVKSAPEKVAPVPYAAPTTKTTETKTVAPEATAPVVVPVPDAVPARASAPTAPEHLMPSQPMPRQSVPAQSVPAQSAMGQSAPALLPPTVPAQGRTNPGIQLPRIQTPGPSLPVASTPRIIPQVAAPQTSDGTRIAEVTPGEIAEVAPATEVAPTVEATPGVETPLTLNAPETSTPVTGVAPQTESAPSIEAQTVEAAPVETAVIEAPKQNVRIAEVPRLPIGERNRGEASLSRAAAVDLAITPATQVQNARASAPIAIARFSQPRLAGRAIIDSPVWSQNAASAQARLSNAELSRLRVGKLNSLNASRPIATGSLTTGKSARALQTSAPTATERPILGRAITVDSVSAPATKLAREAQPALSGTLSKAALNNRRAQPIAPKFDANTAATQTPAPARGAISKAAPSRARVAPIEIAPEFLVNNTDKPARAPQMSVAPAPRMSESASGMNVPSKLVQTTRRSSDSVQSETKATPNGERVAAIPRPDAARRNRKSQGASIVAVPMSQSLQIATPTAFEIPDSYRAERPTTLRAIAARFGLPVELVAISNNWSNDMKVLPGMEVKLPRPLEVSYNGAPVTGDAPSMLMGDTAVTAFRFMFERTGGKMEWDATNQRVVARKEGREITLTIGSNVAKVGEREVMMEIAAFLFQGRTMVPLRFFEEGMNAQVEWNPQTGRLVVAMAG